MIESAVKHVLAEGYRTPDIAGSGSDIIVADTETITEKVIESL